MKKLTLAIVKLDGVKKRLIGECIKRIENEELNIVEIKVVKFNKKRATISLLRIILTSSASIDLSLKGFLAKQIHLFIPPRPREIASLAAYQRI